MEFVILIATAIPFFLLTYFALVAAERRMFLRAAVFGMSAAHEFLLVVFPCWYSVVGNFHFDREVYVTPGELLRVSLYEAWFVFVFLYPFMVRGSERRSRPFVVSRTRDATFMTIVLSSAGFFYAVQLFSPGYSYNQLISSYEVVIKREPLALLLDWLDTIIRWPGLVTGAYVLTSGRYSFWLRILGGGVVLAAFSVAFANGLRGGVLTVIEVTAMSALVNRNWRALVFGIGSAVAIAPLMPWIHNVVRYETAAAAEAGETRSGAILALAPHLGEAFSGEAGAPMHRTFLESWAERAEGPRNSVGLFRLSDQGEGAGYKPVLGALLLPIPRVFWTAKPVGGSTDATNLGAAIYRVQQLKPNTGIGEMGPLLASAHAYWEGGFFGVTIIGLVTGLFWRTLICWAEDGRRSYRYVVVFCFMAALPIDGFLTALNPMYAFILSAYKLMPVLLIILFERLSLQKSYRTPRNCTSMARSDRRITATDQA